MKIKNYKLKITNSRRAGFSLVELMFAMVFLSVIVFGVVKLQTSNLTVSNTNKNELQAYFYANQGIEIVKGLGYGKLCTPDTPPTTCDKYIKFSNGSYSLINTDTDQIPEPFNRIIRVEDAGLTAGYKVTSIIEWTDSTGKHDLAGGAVKVSQIIF